MALNQTIYDNSKDALAAIMREYGAEVLLGSSLKSFFNDYAPGIKRSRKNVVFLVPQSGAAEILKRSISAGTEEQEIAYRKAVQKVIDECPIERSEAESVVLEFTAALGWRINVPPTPQTPAPEPEKPQQQQQPQTQPKPAQQSGPMSVIGNGLTPGQRNVSFGKYLWRVLDVQNNRALLLAEEVLEQRCYHDVVRTWEEFKEGVTKELTTTWETCELRRYLNGEFLKSFSSQEQKQIAQTENRNADNPRYGTSGGRDTVDKVFLLSIDEVVKYFGGRLRNRSKHWGYIDDRHNKARIAKYQGEKAWWWLRSPGISDDSAAIVDNFGWLHIDGIYVGYKNGVRPALWLNL